MNEDHECERPDVIQFVGWGGKTARRPTTWHLGWTTADTSKLRGVRRAIFDVAYGIVNGFPASAILYYILTRDTHPAVLHWAWKREGACPGDVQLPNGSWFPPCLFCGARKA